MPNCNLIPHIAQHGESEFIFFLRTQRIVRQLRRDGYDLRRKLLKLRQSALKASQVQIAIGAPAAPVKDKNDWTLTQQRLQADAAALCVGQHKVRSDCAGLEGPALDPGGPKGFRFGIHHQQGAGGDDFAAIFCPCGIEFLSSQMRGHDD
jgi:hypothetical protein